MPAPISETLANFSASLRFEAIPAKAVDAVVLGVTDFCGVHFAGMDSRLAKLLEAEFSASVGRPEASIQFGSKKLAASDAALINSATACTVVYDDVAFGGCHTSAVLVPALFAEAEVTGASGKDIIRAYAAGYEAWARLAERDPDTYSSKGWHATATFGPVAVAIAVANLRGFDAETTLRAIGLAAAMSGGITASFDTDVAAFQIGRAAAAGITAARLAKAGASAPSDGLERTGRGLLVALSPNGKVDLDTPITDLGTAWRLETVGIHVKQYPFGNMLQRALDGILDIVAANKISPDQVAGVAALISEKQDAVVSKSPSVVHFVPGFSIGLGVAAALINGRAGFDELKPEFYERPDVQRIIGLTKRVARPDVPEDTTPNLGYSGGLEVTLVDGRVFSALSVPFARGHWTRPMSTTEAETKFVTCAGPRLGEDGAKRLFASLWALRDLKNIGDLPVTS